MLDPAILAVVKSVKLERIYDIFCEKIFILVTMERSFTRNNEIKWFLFLDENDFIPYVLLLASVWQLWKPHSEKHCWLVAFFVCFWSWLNHWAHFPERRRWGSCLWLLLGSWVGTVGDDFVVGDVSEETRGRRCDWFLVGENVKTCYPEISNILCFRFELVDPLFSYKMKLLIFDNFDGVDFWEINAFSQFCEGLVCVVIETVI